MYRPIGSYDYDYSLFVRCKLKYIGLYDYDYSLFARCELKYIFL